MTAGGQVFTFLNSSSARQQKTGSLLIGQRSDAVNCPNVNDPNDFSDCSVICLNADKTLGTLDTTGAIPNCIYDWSQLAGGSQLFMRLFTGTQAATIDTDPTKSDRGFFDVTADRTKYQAISVLADPSNTFVGSIGLQAVSGSSSTYSATFAGRVALKKSSGNVDLCLNGTCIKQWVDALALPADAVWLQSTVNLVTQTGAIGVNGPVVVGTSTTTTGGLVAGTPDVITPVALSCGDGLCSNSNGEQGTESGNPGYCPVDCL